MSLVMLCTLAVVVVIFIVYYWRKYAFDAKSLAGKRVLVTGASSGIGAEIAYFYARHGASLVITARRLDLLRDVAAKCRRLGACKVDVVQADMTVVDDCERLVAETKRIFAGGDLAGGGGGGLDHLVLNHGIMNAKLWSADEIALQERLLTVNFVSYQRIFAGLIDLLIASKGHVGVTSSGAGNAPIAYSSIYGATKYALQGFFGSLRQEMRIRKTGVSITVAVLGYINTEMATDVLRASLGNLMDYMAKPAAVDECASAIVRAITARAREIHFPTVVKYLTLLHQLCPSLYDFIVIMFYSQKK